MNTGLITHIEPRKNYIIRRSSNLSKEAHILAANIDQAFLMITLVMPETPLEFADRFLLTAEAYHIPVILLINKTDLLSWKVLIAAAFRYRNIPVCRVYLHGNFGKNRKWN